VILVTDPEHAIPVRSDPQQLALDRGGSGNTGELLLPYLASIPTSKAAICW